MLQKSEGGCGGGEGSGGSGNKRQVSSYRECCGKSLGERKGEGGEGMGAEEALLGEEWQ